MAVLVTFRVSGDSDSLLERYDAATHELEDRVATDDGMMVADVWRSDEEARAVLDGSVWRDSLERNGIPQPEVTVYDVHRSVHNGG